MKIEQFVCLFWNGFNILDEVFSLNALLHAIRINVSKLHYLDVGTNAGFYWMEKWIKFISKEKKHILIYYFGFKAKRKDDQSASWFPIKYRRLIGDRSKECQGLYPLALDADVWAGALHHPQSPAWSRHHRMPATGQPQPPHTEDGGLVSVSPGTQSGQHQQLTWHWTLQLTNWPLVCSSSTRWSSSVSTPAPPRPPWRRPAPRRQTPASSTPSPSSMFPWTGPALTTPPSTAETPSLWPSETQSSFSFFSLPRLLLWQTFRWDWDDIWNRISLSRKGVGRVLEPSLLLLPWQSSKDAVALII